MNGATYGGYWEYLGRGFWEGLKLGLRNSPPLPVRGAAFWGQKLPLGPLLPFRTRAGPFQELSELGLVPGQYCGPPSSHAENKGWS